MKNKKKIAESLQNVWDIIRSPRVFAALKVAAAALTVVHAIDGYLSVPSRTQRVGFRK